MLSVPCTHIYQGDTRKCIHPLVWKIKCILVLRSAIRYMRSEPRPILQHYNLSQFRVFHLIRQVRLTV